MKPKKALKRAFKRKYKLPKAEVAIENKIGASYYGIPPSKEDALKWANFRVARGAASDVKILGDIMIGKGIGSEIWFSWHDQINAAVSGVAAGYFDLLMYNSWGLDASIRVRFTAAGMAYFDSLPRLELECA